MDNKEHKKDTPEISVIIPAFNRESFIPSLIQQIKNQTLKSFECIIVDDGSVDQTGTLCDSLTVGDGRFVVKHTANFGVSHARNVALDIARGEYITFIDSDDSIPSDYLEKLHNRIKTTQVDMVIGSFNREYADGRTEKVDYPFEERVYSFEELANSFAQIQKKSGVYGRCWGKIFLRKTAFAIRFDDSLKLAEDLDYYLKLYPQIHTVYFDNDCEYGYYTDAENSSVQVADEDIDYIAQLRISIRYKDFLERLGVFSGENERIVSEQILNYVFFSIYHSRLSNLRDVFREACELYKQSGVKPEKKSGLKGSILDCVFRGNENGAVGIMTVYKTVRKLLKGL